MRLSRLLVLQRLPVGRKVLFIGAPGPQVAGIGAHHGRVQKHTAPGQHAPGHNEGPRCRLAQKCLTVGIFARLSGQLVLQIKVVLFCCHKDDLFCFILCAVWQPCESRHLAAAFFYNGFLSLDLPFCDQKGSEKVPLLRGSGPRPRGPAPLEPQRGGRPTKKLKNAGVLHFS